MAIQKVDKTVKEATWVVRFQEKMEKIFMEQKGETQTTPRMRRLIQGYAISIDNTLKSLEEKNLKKPKQYQKPAYTWENVDLPALSNTVMHYSQMGFNPLLSNHLSFVPYWDSTKNKYTMTPIPGYRGLEMKAKKYGLDVPDNIVIKLIHENEKFVPIWKDINHEYDHYKFIPADDPFDPGKVVGGFWYYEYKDRTKNRLKLMSLKDILKRKPEYASPEFWGGTKDEYLNGKKTGKKVEIEGWFEEMCLKTIARDAYNNITIDQDRIDDAFEFFTQTEISRAKIEAEHEIKENANKEYIDIEPVDASTQDKQDKPDISRYVKPKQTDEDIEPGY